MYIIDHSRVPHLVLSKSEPFLKAIHPHVEQIYFGKGYEPWGDWNSWCIMPTMWVTGAMQMAGIGLDMEMDRMEYDMHMDAIASVPAMAQWQLTKGVYTIHEALFDELVKCPTSTGIRLPASVLKRLPESCLYLSFPRPLNLDTKKFEDYGEAEGCFISLESEVWGTDAFTHSISDHLTVSFYREDGEPVGMPIVIPLEERNICELLEKGVDEFYNESFEGHYVSDPKQKEFFRDFNFSHAGLALSLALYLCSEEPEFDDSEYKPRAIRNTRPKPRRKARLLPASNPRVVGLGQELGKKILEFNKANATREFKGRKAHIRKQHWHGFWKGKRNSDERRLTYKYLHPVMVSGLEADSHDGVG